MKKIFAYNLKMVAVAVTIVLMFAISIIVPTASTVYITMLIFGSGTVKLKYALLYVPAIITVILLWASTLTFSDYEKKYIIGEEDDEEE